MKLVIVVSALLAVAFPCSIPKGLKPKLPKDRIKQAQAVVKGEVTSIIKLRNGYIMTYRVDCILKNGAGVALGASVRISNPNAQYMCINDYHKLNEFKGKDSILQLRYESNSWFTDNVNLQWAVYSLSEVGLSDAKSALDVTAGAKPSGGKC